ncbi:hypothetical protein MKW92_039711 [Papaver armeniacum]|nr:hypothetical protein MKW92_039711 [Papaver armeniacum]
MEASSIHDQPAMSLEEEEEMRSMALYREELIERKIIRKQRAAAAAGREFIRGNYKTTGYDWLLIPPSKLEHCFMKIPGEGSHCVASDPTPTQVTTARKEAIGVEGKDCNLCNN